MTPCPEPGAVVVEIEGITPPARFVRLADALAALWESMRVLPLGDQQADWFGYYLTRPDAVLRVSEKLSRDSDLALSFALPDGPHVMRVRQADQEGSLAEMRVRPLVSAEPPAASGGARSSERLQLMHTSDLHAAAWRKSSYSGSVNDCVEVADGFVGLLPVRDSKDAVGPALVFAADAWRAFVAGVRSGELPAGG